jgi:hypothetical protein
MNATHAPPPKCIGPPSLITPGAVLKLTLFDVTTVLHVHNPPVVLTFALYALICSSSPESLLPILLSSLRRGNQAQQLAQVENTLGVLAQAILLQAGEHRHSVADFVVFGRRGSETGVPIQYGCASKEPPAGGGIRCKQETAIAGVRAWRWPSSVSIQHSCFARRAGRT